jgi:hypothetical protein
MVQLFATRCSCIAILWVSPVSFAAITLCVASKRVFIVVVYFVIDSVRKLFDIPSTDVSTDNVRMSVRMRESASVCICVGNMVILLNEMCILPTQTKTVTCFKTNPSSREGRRPITSFCNCLNFGHELQKDSMPRRTNWLTDWLTDWLTVSCKVTQDSVAEASQSNSLVDRNINSQLTALIKSRN